MKLLSSDLSPYSARVRMTIAVKQLDVDIIAPDVPLRSDAFLEKYPFGKIPVLLLDDGRQLSESWSIMEYLDSLSETSPLMPVAPFERAEVQARGRFADLHLAPALFPLFASLLHKTPIDLDEQMGKVKAELAKGERIWAQKKPVTEAFDLADIALVPVMYFVQVTPKLMGYHANPLENCPTLTSWWNNMLEQESISCGVKEIEDAFKALASK